MVVWVLLVGLGQPQLPEVCQLQMPLPALVVLAAFAYLYAVTWIESRQAQQLESKQPYASTTVSESRKALT